ncbi:SulP family inorganic anion transporter [Sulfurirhabdus autotrophica]|uniref:SulP family sulfate permease n=1 Tax=Sulfurirhabdus autotrophica TaxID=1706046 RepID=A0A4R3YIL1_9PROT|nr:SulP family inorganic anion transporter [Sulfurirhabdus autotrophica]TCV90503.1 SulP family sulfate permease [Sulfurirhabdus autotrophica]
MKDILACNLWLYKVFPFLRWWPMVTKESSRADLMAGLTGAMIVLPQGVAFATIAGMPPEYGLYAAMIPAIIGALFGSSWHLVSGPTTAISIAVFASVSPHAAPGSPDFISLVLTLTFMVGLFELILGMARMGALVNFISHTVVIGFTAGAAILIASSQIKHFFGISIPRGTPFHETIHQLFLQIGDINLYVTGVGLITLVSGILFKKFYSKFPYMIAAMIIGSLVAVILNTFFGGIDATQIKTVGALPSGLPPLSHPDLSLTSLQHAFFPALVVTMLALTEAVSISRAIAVKSEQRIDGNQEFIGQGLSNIFGSFFSGYASSGSFNRSGVNYASGARTPLAAVFASIFLIIILLLVAPLAAYLPTAAMAGILFLVAWGLIDFHHIASILKTSRVETTILAVTFIGTLIDLEKGIFFGITLSLALYLYRTSRPTVRDIVPDTSNEKRKFSTPREGMHECPQLKTVRIDGSIFFGAVNHIQTSLQQIDEYNPQHKHVLVVADGINFVDLAGGEMLVQEAKRRKKMNGGLYFKGVKEGACEMIKKGGYIKDIGNDNIFKSKTTAITTIYSKLDSEICRNCTVRIFRECHQSLPNGEPR